MSTLFTRFHSKQIPPTGWNNYRYANCRLGEAQEILSREMVNIPVYNTKETVVTRASVKGFVPHPVEYNLGLWKTWLDR